ncbi:hypothetical protein S14_109 [Shewanella sp. phage 1/4]|uniref:hypothetical protein n=1 Tax=Shewanella phage 1/4 TaxID=1458859 RepID=UPI0004F7EA71|nr:hypothetical protein S14_109 [Shewanella sp. phage 1/4]AHK11218.1 hypothetical protein S14_109 [Shewanella sp. phage 1/4]
MSLEKMECGVNYTTETIRTNINGLIDQNVSGIKSLESLGLYDGMKVSTNGFYVDTLVGGGNFVYDASKDKSLHNGGTVIAPEAIAAWDGSQVNLASLLNWAGTGTGCFVRLGKYDISSPLHNFGGGSEYSDNSKSISKMQAIGLTTDITGHGSIRLTSTSICNSGLRIFSSDKESKIVGFNGLGFGVGGGDISLVGVGIEGFYDGTELNKTNYTTAFCRVLTGSDIGSIVIDNVNATNNRSIIIAGSVVDDFMPDVTISCKKLSIKNSHVENCPMPVNWRGLCDESESTGNTYKNIIGAGRIVAAHKVYLDGIAYSSSSYLLCKNHKFIGNTVNTVVNRTTTGSSTTGNNYECHAVMLSGVKVIVSDNIITDCTGNVLDTEAIYLKAYSFDVHDNILTDAGSDEAAINLKGINDDGSTSSTSPFGYFGTCHSNIIEFTRSSYDNGGTIVNMSGKLTGIHVAAPSFVTVKGNKIKGADANDIRVNGWSGSKNQGCSVVDNHSYNFGGSESILWRGAFYDAKSNGNEVIDPIIPSTLTSFYHTRFLSVSGRGIENRNTEFKCNSISADVSDGRFNGKSISLLSLDLENYNFKSLSTGGNIFDVKYGASSPLFRVYDITSQTGSPTGFLFDIKALKDSVNVINSPYWFWGNQRVDGYSIEIECENITNNVNVTAQQFPVVANKVTSLNSKSDFSFDGVANVGSRWRVATYSDSAGSAIQNNKADVYSFRASASGEVDLSLTGAFATLRIFNTTTSDMRVKTIIKASSV